MRRASHRRVPSGSERPHERPNERGPGSFSIVLSRKVDFDVGQRVAKLKINLKLAAAPSSLNTLLKNVPVLSEAFLK